MRFDLQVVTFREPSEFVTPIVVHGYCPLSIGFVARLQEAASCL